MSDIKLFKLVDNGVCEISGQSVAVEKSLQNLIEKHHAVPLFLRGNSLFLGVSDPTDQEVIDAISFSSGFRVEPIIVASNQIEQTIERALQAANPVFDEFEDEDGLEDIGADEHATLGHPSGADLPPGTRAIVSPTDGVFYRKSAPDAPFFVEIGQKIRVGHAVGLVEVMKTFNQILYEGPGFPEEAEVVEVRANDAQEVSAGEVLVVIR